MTVDTDWREAERQKLRRKARTAEQRKRHRTRVDRAQRAVLREWRQAASLLDSARGQYAPASTPGDATLLHGAAFKGPNRGDQAPPGTATEGGRR
jgi:hypothetical protein